MEWLARNFATEIKWMAWNKAWEVANRRYGYEEAAAKDAARVEQNVAAAFAMAIAASGNGGDDSWKSVLEHVRLMTHDAGWHANNTRVGNAKDAGGDKKRFEKHAEHIALSQTVSSRLLYHLKWMCWNAAWHAANERAKNLPDARKDKCMFRKHARLLHKREEKGVNIGGWLLLERWMCSSVFEGSQARDEYSLSTEGDAAHERIRAWRESFISEQDFADIAASGFNCVRLPFGAWCVDGAGVDASPFVRADGYLDKALDWAEAHGLAVILDLHSAPGFQSGHQACGRSDDQWQPSMWDIPQTLRLLESVAFNYKPRACVTGLAVINEPANTVDAAALVQFFLEAYAVIRKHMPPEAVTIYFPVYTRSIDVLVTLGLRPEELRNVRVDLHLYQCFGSDWQSRALLTHLDYAKSGTGHCPGIDGVLRAGFEVVVSEWSLRLPLWNPAWPPAQEWSALDRASQNQLLRQFALNQTAQFRKKASGWTFWCWKVDSSKSEPYWSAKECLSRGWLQPQDF